MRRDLRHTNGEIAHCFGPIAETFAAIARDLKSLAKAATQNPLGWKGVLTECTDFCFCAARARPCVIALVRAGVLPMTAISIEAPNAHLTVANIYKTCNIFTE